jgi:hypothetical protein
MKHEYGALLERESPEGALELVAIVDGQDVGRLCLAVHRQHPDLCLHAAPTSGLGVALMRQDPVQPGFESVGVAQRPELTPTGDQRGLHRVIGPIGVTQDPERNRHAAISDHARKGIEGLPIPVLCLINERSLHPTLPL